MTQDQLKHLKKTIVFVGEYYGRELNPQVIGMMAEDLSDLEFEKVIRAYDVYRRNPKNRTFPLPAVIRDLVQPAVDPDSAAREIASRIHGAIVKFGWCGAKGAQAYIGEIGWGIVERFGGWQFICERHGLSIDPGQFQAQTRELAKGQIQYDPKALANAIGLSQLPSVQHLSLVQSEEGSSSLNEGIS